MLKGTKAKNITILKKINKYRSLYLMLIPAILLLAIFSYAPMFGVIIGFKDLNPRLGVFGSPWADPALKYFMQLFGDSKFWSVLWDTVWISFLRLIFGFPVPVILALLYNEIRNQKFKRFSQTVLYLPYFLSWVVLAGIFKTIFLNEGSFNILLKNLGLSPVPFLTSRSHFLPFLVISDIWKNMGFSSIIYLAAISGIDNSLYEAADIDGAGRFSKMRYITLPSIAVAISINLILQTSNILNGGFDQIYNLDTTGTFYDIIDTYLYRIAFVEGANYSLATALGLFKSVVGFVIIIITNKIANKLGDAGIW
ncbi:MAG TPA: ABC transporter permease subunit [Clostridia bacterium]